MNKKLGLLLAVCLITNSLVAKTNIKDVKEVKNVILMIADGTSLPTLSVSRWVNRLNHPEQIKLNVDEYLSGTVQTTCVNAPIGDSAPTTGTFMTGHSAPAGFISTYSNDFGKDNLEPVDPKKAYGPAATIMEACKQLKGKSIGLVVTVNFNHATPADCASHYYNRGKTDILASQIVHNDIDVVLGSGNKYLTPALEEVLNKNGTEVVRNDIAAMRNSKSNKLWALFYRDIFKYEIDADTTKQPTLSEMTSIAIEKLSKNKKGFFLMVEGSQIDFAAHNNDIAGMISETLSFDRAIKVAMDFAKKDGNTAVVILSDHGTSGVTIGKYGLKNYSLMSAEKIFGSITKFKRSADGICELLQNNPYTEAKNIFKEYADIELTDKEYNELLYQTQYRQSPISVEKRKLEREKALYTSSFSAFVSEVMKKRTNLGFSTGGHSGEDVFLACYNPNNQPIMGMNTNVELSHYLFALCGMYNKMDDFSESIFAHSDEVLKGYDYSIVKEEGKFPVLKVKNKKNGKNLEIESNTNRLKLNGKTIYLPSVVVYVDKTDLFYLPKNIINYLN